MGRRRRWWTGLVLLACVGCSATSTGAPATVTVRTTVAAVSGPTPTPASASASASATPSVPSSAPVPTAPTGTAEVSPGSDATPTGSGSASGPAPGSASATASASDPASASPDPSAGTSTADGPGPTATRVAARLATAAKDPRLGGAGFSALVVDPRTGATLFTAHDPTAATLPASTQKVLLAAAVLTSPSVHPGDRLTTTVVQGAAPGDIVLVGGGDVTLTATASSALDPGAATVADLAAQVRASGVPVTRILTDTHAWATDPLAPGWDSADIAGGDTTRMGPLMVDGDRTDPADPDSPRTGTPDAGAGRALAKALGHPALPVVTGQATPAGARVLARTQSPPLAQLVQSVLTRSDNVLAEALGRYLAARTGRPTTFAGAAAALRTAVTALGVPAASLTLRDVSGLSRQDRIPLTALTTVLSAAVSGRVAGLQPLLAGLPVAGRTGTLTADAPYYRYSDRASQSAVGAVHAKTGTLQTTYALAGFLTDTDGDPIVFAVHSTDAKPEAKTGQDDLTAALHACGCR